MVKVSGMVFVGNLGIARVPLQITVNGKGQLATHTAVALLGGSLSTPNLGQGTSPCTLVVA